MLTRFLNALTDPYGTRMKGVARRAVKQALESGLLFRSERCYRCRKETTTEAHHHRGYEERNWLRVLWLCRLCHRGAHAAEQRGEPYSFVLPIAENAA